MILSSGSGVWHLAKTESKIEAMDDCVVVADGVGLFEEFLVDAESHFFLWIERGVSK